MPDERVLKTWENENPVGSMVEPEADTDAAGPFGPILRGHEGDWKGAALALEAMQDGEAPGALSHPEVGPIALVWGREGTGKSDGFGLSKMLAYHPEMLDDLQGRLSRMAVRSRSANRIRLIGESDQADIRLEWDGTAKTWFLGGYDRGSSRRTEKSTARLRDLWGGRALPPQRDTTSVAENREEVTATEDGDAQSDLLGELRGALGREPTANDLREYIASRRKIMADRTKQMRTASADGRRTLEQRNAESQRLMDEAQAALEAMVGDEPDTAASRSGRIEDFGEKIEGARKDDARLARDLAATLSMADEPLSKTWPVPDYAALPEPQVIGDREVDSRD